MNHTSTKCKGRLNTLYVRVTVRNARTHHKAQAWVPCGHVCLDCHAMEWAPGEEKNHRLIRDSLKRRETPEE